MNELLIYVIVNKKTNEIWRTHKGKKVWTKKGAAKSAFVLGNKYRYSGGKSFDEQDVFEERELRVVV